MTVHSRDEADLARPDLPAPACKVRLVCGPPAAGKSTYVAEHADAADIVIDLDMIARDHGYGRSRPSEIVGELLADRNARLAALADEPADRVAWVILGAPSPSLRQWWCDHLGVKPGDLTVLVPPLEELRRRVMRDPDRKPVRWLHMRVIEQWLARERENDPGPIRRGVAASGQPTDPLHPWNAAHG